MIPFFAFALGTHLDLAKVWQAGLLGVGLGLAVVVVTGIPLFFADRLTGGNGVAGVRGCVHRRQCGGGPGHYCQRQPGTPMRPRKRPSWWRPALWLPPSWCRWSLHGPQASRCAQHLMPDRWLIVADDLTGAADSGVAFAQRGWVTEVFWGETPPGEDTAVWAFDADSRSCAPGEAGRRHRDALRRCLTPDGSAVQENRFHAARTARGGNRRA